MIIDGAFLPFKKGSIISSVAWRRDKLNKKSYQSFSGGKLRLQIGYTDRDGKNFSSNFNSNWKGIPTTVFHS